MRRVLVPLIVLVLLMAVAAPVHAREVRTPFTSQLETEVVDAGTVRVTPGGVLVVRDEVSAGTEDILIDGVTYPGEVTLSLNVTLNLETLRGSLHGTFELETPGIDTWTGTVRGVIRDGVASGTFVGRGMDGTLQRGSFVQLDDGRFEAEGVIISPPGRAGWSG